jgi:hypothetical protein
MIRYIGQKCHADSLLFGDFFAVTVTFDVRKMGFEGFVHGFCAGDVVCGGT